MKAHRNTQTYGDWQVFRSATAIQSPWVVLHVPSELVLASYRYKTNAVRVAQAMSEQLPDGLTGEEVTVATPPPLFGWLSAIIMAQVVQPYGGGPPQAKDGTWVAGDRYDHGKKWKELRDSRA